MARAGRFHKGERMDRNVVFEDRREAGKALGELLGRYRGPDTIVLGLPRGGIVVADEIATALGAPLMAYPARKLGAPGHPEYGIGAVAPGGIMVLDERAVELLGISEEALERVRAAETEELERRQILYGDGSLEGDLRGKTVILADDGLATGVTALAAVRSIRQQEPALIVLAAPVCAAHTAEMMKSEADEVVCVSMPEQFRAVGQWYDDFRQVEDEEVLELLGRAKKKRSEGGSLW
jgi:putative phosphoribosyl transferase